MRTLVKRIAERALIASGVANAARASRRGDTLILAYHNVLPDGAEVVGDTSLHLPLREFTRQLDVLAEAHEVVPLSSALVMQAARSERRPRVVITFDDAYVGALISALPELVKRNMPATVFVAPGLLGTETWWDRLADPTIGAVRAELRDKLLGDLHGEGSAIKKAYVPGQPSHVLVEAYRIATDDEIAAAARLPGVSLGSHTWSHSNLASLDVAGVDRELRESHQWLRERFDSYVPWLSYPYGLFSADAERIAAECGYVGSVMVAGGWVGGDVVKARHRIPRFNVPASMSLDGYRLRVSGLGAR